MILKDDIAGEFIPTEITVNGKRKGAKRNSVSIRMRFDKFEEMYANSVNQEEVKKNE